MNTSKHIGPAGRTAESMHLTIRMTKVNDQPSLPPFNPSGSSGNLEEAKAVLKSLVTAMGEYASAGDLSRAIALLLTPMIVRMGMLSREQCPPCRIYPKKARQAFAGILKRLYGDANAGCGLGLA